MQGLVHHAVSLTGMGLWAHKQLVMSLKEAWEHHLYTPAGSASPSRQAPGTHYCGLARNPDALLLLQAFHHALHDWAHGLSS